MKAFIASCSVLLVLTVAVFCSGARVGRATDSILYAAENDPDPALLRETWEREKPFLLLLIHRYETDKVDSALSSLEAATAAGDAGLAADSLARLTDALRSVRRVSGPPWSG